MDAVSPPLSIDQLATLRNKTEAASKVLDSHLKSYLDTMKPLLAPKRVLGRHVAAREEVNISDRMLDQLKQQYSQVMSQAPFSMAIEFPEQTLSHLDNLPMVYAWEYRHTAKSATAEKVLTITFSANVLAFNLKKIIDLYEKIGAVHALFGKLSLFLFSQI